MRKSLLFLILLLNLVFSLFFIANEAKAGDADNVSGWAWSENIGWISFNCDNPELPAPRCANDYGVNIDPSTGVFSGYAWSENIGWIDFGPAGPYPDLPNYSACLDFPSSGQTCDGTGDYQASGWAKVLSNNSWIKLKGQTTETPPTDYGVSWDPADNQELKGWAWSDIVIGWISFNCKDGGYNEATGEHYNICGTSNYKVVAEVDNTPPTVSVIYEPSTITTTWQKENATATVDCHDPEPATGCNIESYMLKTYSPSSPPTPCPTACGTLDWTTATSSSPKTISSHVCVCGAAKDNVGNVGFSSPVEFKVDQITPSTQITSSPVKTWYNDDFWVVFKDSDTGGSGLANEATDTTCPTESCTYLIVGLNPTSGESDCSSGMLTRCCKGAPGISKNVPVGEGSCSTSNICIFEGAGRCKVQTWVYDIAGNVKTESKNFSIDFTDPTVGPPSLTTPPAEQGKTETFEATLKDDIGKIAGCQFYMDNWNNPVTAEITINPIPCENGIDCTVSADYTLPASGNHQFRFYCYDVAGNAKWGNSVTITVGENHLPEITAGPTATTTPPTGGTPGIDYCTTFTTQPNCKVYFSANATDTDKDTLTYTWDFGNTETAVGTVNYPYPDITASSSYTTSGPYTIEITVDDNRGGTDASTTSITVTAPTLFVNLTADPPKGTLKPDLSGLIEPIDLTAAVSGTAYGTINYRFDCTDIEGCKNSPNPEVDCDYATTTQTTETFTAVDVCNYNIAGTYIAGTFVERGINSKVATTSIKVTENQPPVAGICCQSCLSPNCITYTGDVFTLINNSSDPNGLGDIIKSEWDIYNWGTDPDLSCTPPDALCDFTPQTQILGSGNYTAELYVEDQSGASASTTQSFTIKQDAIADFKCSLDNSTWKDCVTLRPVVNEIVYFLDQSSPSEGASITNRSWTFPDGDPATNIDNETNPSTKFKSAGAKEVSLTITDSAGRTASRDYTINIQLPLPEWEEIAPF